MGVIGITPFKYKKMKNKIIDLFGNNTIVKNTGDEYSKLLQQFISPFTNDFKDFEYIEDIFEFAINTWNVANINTIIPNSDIEKLINYDDLLIKKMVAYKEEKFKDYTNFIVDFELTEANPGKAPILTVVTQNQDIYLNNMLNATEDKNLYNAEEFEENYINRYAIIVKPKQPFIDWLNNLHDISTLDDVGVDVYLVNDEINDIDKFLRKKFDKVFTMVLHDWHTNKKEWPQKRNYKMFEQWFRVEVSEMVYDLEKKPILKSM